MNELANRTADVIAAEINSIRETTQKIVIANSIEIGRRLVEVKEMVEHGQWKNWLEENVDYSQSTANNLMKIYREYGDGQLLSGPNSQTFANLPYSKAVLLLGMPKDDREEFIEKNDVESLSARNLQKAIKENQELEKKLAALQSDLDTEQGRIEQLEKKLGDAEDEKEKVDNQVQLLSNQLKSAENTGSSEDVERLQSELREKEQELETKIKKMKELEDQLKEKPIEVPAVIEKVPEDVQKELEQLRKQVKGNEEPSQEYTDFKFAFDVVVKNFGELLQSLEKFEDQKESEKYKEAVNKVITMMQEQLN